MLFNTEADYKFVNPIRLDSDSGLLALQALVDSRFLFTHILHFFLLSTIIGRGTCAPSLRYSVNAHQWESFHEHLVPVSAPSLYKVSCLHHSNSVLRKTTSVTKPYGAFYISQCDNREKGRHWNQPFQSSLCEAVVFIYLWMGMVYSEQKSLEEIQMLTKGSGDRSFSGHLKR